MRYPIALTQDDNDTLLVTFPDVPEAVTYGEDEADARARAVDALATALEGRMRAREALPRPSAVRGRPFVDLPASMEMKALLYETMRAQHVTKARLGRLLDCHPPQVDRLFELRHASRVERIEEAFRALGKHLVIEVEDEPRRRRGRRLAAAG